MNWRTVYLITIGVRFVFALADSYIHPDEHFQTFEIIAGRVAGYTTNEPWEFGPKPARSLGPIYLVYGPVFALCEYFQLDLAPIHRWYLARLLVMAVSWIITDYCLFKMLPTKQERIKAIFFNLTSYVTLVFATHGFSNSVESVIVIAVIYLIDDLRSATEANQCRSPLRLYLIGTLFALGIFNRVTFPVFVALPSWFVARYLWHHKVALFPLAFGLLSTALSLVLFDTAQFASISVLWEDPFVWSNYVVAPLNNITYNTNYSNLSQHGIHNRFTHLAVNLPQLMGPGLLLLGRRYWKTTAFLAALGAVLILSFVPHQELRFLTPVVPLLCASFDFGDGQNRKASSYRHLVINAWYIFNIILAVLFGVYHQGGVVPAAHYLHENVISNGQDSIQIWWRTYSPPTWILGDVDDSTEVVNITSELDQNRSNHIYDCMGADVDKVHALIEQHTTKPWFSLGYTPKQVFLITPSASFNGNFNSLLFNETFHHTWHLDLDHLDWLDLTSFEPGLGVYEVL